MLFVWSGLRIKGRSGRGYLIGERERD